MTQPIDYAPPPPRESVPWATIARIATPLVATSLLFYIVASNAYNEPYGVFNWSDAIEQVGGPAVVALLWVAWLVAAWARRVQWFILLPVLLWAAFTSWIAYQLGTGYFDEIWNQP